MAPYFPDPYGQQRQQSYVPQAQYNISLQQQQQQMPVHPQSQFMLQQQNNQHQQQYHQPPSPQHWQQQQLLQQQQQHFQQQQWQQPPPAPVNYLPAHQQPQYFDPDAFQYNAIHQPMIYNQQPPFQQPYLPPQAPASQQQQYHSLQLQQDHQQTFQAQQLPSMSPPPPVTVRQPPQQPRVLQEVQPNTPRQQPVQKPPPQTVPEEPEPDYPSLLLTLADEYLDAANKLKDRSEDYFKLMATALACMESTLTNFKLTSLRETQLSLKYAQLLYDETTNYDDAETTLTKAIDICDRMKFVDLKYASQLLLAKVLYKSKPKAAMRDLQGMIQDIETYHHIAWEYCFRFQHVLFSMELGGTLDVNTAVTHVERVQHVARQNGDHAIFAFAAISEALLHLHSSSLDSITQSQSALAKARSLQLNPDIENNPQMPVMIEFINLACSIQAHEHEQIEQKRRILQDVLYKSIESGCWNERGLIFLPLNQKSLCNLSTEEGGMFHEEKGSHHLVFSWMNKDEAEAVGFLLCGASTAHKNIIDGGKAEKYMLEGLKIPKELLANKLSQSNKVSELKTRWKILEIQFLLEAGFLQSSRGQWSKAQIAVRDISTITKTLSGKLPLEIEAQLDYLKGCIQQGTGDLDAAFNIFQSPALTLQQQTSTPSSTNRGTHSASEDTIRQISILAAMNTAFIVLSPSHPRHYTLQSLIDNLNITINDQSSPVRNKHINGAYSFLLAVMPNSTILRTKQYLGQALDAAKKVAGNQIVGLTLTVMQEKFFKGVVPDTQAVKCARAATHQVKTRWGDPLWTAVASSLEAECLSMLGNREESENRRVDAIKALEMVPERVKQNLV